jgi:WD40 repeat protein
MDLSPADPEGRRLLAVGGYGVQASRGELVLFRLPGRPEMPTGEVAAVLPEGYRDPTYDPNGPSGHVEVVQALRFHPKVRGCLASGSLDGTVRLWNIDDLDNPQTFVTLRRQEVFRTLAGLREDLRNRVFDEDVQELAFTPDGRWLIVCFMAKAPDGTRRGYVRVWDASNLGAPVFRSEVINPAHPDGRAGAWVNPRGLAISPDGRWVFVGQENGLIVRYELDAAGQLINPALMPTGPDRGPVEAIACGMTPNGSRLLSSIIGRRHDDPLAAPPLACDIDLWPLPDPRIPAGQPAPASNPTRIGQSNGRVRALGFSPDGSLAAFGGGDAQEIALRDLSRPIADPNTPDISLVGQGRTIWDVRFRPDSGAVGFSRVRPGAGEPPEVYQGFELAADFRQDPDRMIDLDPEGLVGASTTSTDGRWSIRPREQDGHPSLELSVIEAATGRERGMIRLDENRDVRWWCFGFVPPGEGHPTEVVAVGTEGGVAIFGLVDDGGECPRVRELAGHSGPVFSLAPSPDGRWLATGSADQTVQLWPLQSIDRVPTLGATLTPEATPEGRIRWRVSEVQPGSFSQQMRMRDEDRITQVFMGMELPVDPGQLGPRIDALPPGRAAQFVAYRQDPETGAFDQKIGESLVSGYMTRKRDRPALTLFPDVDREWIAWTPEGFYQASIRGEAESLAWHRNRSARGGETVLDPLIAFAGELRRADVLDALIESADPVVALGQAIQEEAGLADLAENGAKPLPQVDAMIAESGASTAEPVVIAEGPVVPLDLLVKAADDQPGEFDRKGAAIKAVEVLVNARVAFRQEFDQAVSFLARRGAEAIPLELDAGLNAVSVAVEDEDGRRVHRGPAVTVFGPVKDPDVPQLRILTIGINALDHDQFPEIAHASRDAERVGLFLKAPNNRPRYADPKLNPLLGDQAEAEAVEDALRSLVEASPIADGGQQTLGPGDTIFVFINSHFVDLVNNRGDANTDAGDGPGLLMAGGPGRDGPRAVPVGLLSEVLGTLAGNGCKVVVLLDLHHDPHPEAFQRRAMTQWVRDDLVGRGVIVCLASNAGPSSYVGALGGAAEVEHGAFALGLLRLFDNADAIPPRLRQGAGEASWTLLDFQHALAANVRSSSRNKRQQIGFYRPRSISPRALIFDPPSPLADHLAGVGGE